MIIFQDLTMAADVKKYGPLEIQHFLKSKQTLLDVDKSNNIPADTTPTILTAKTSQYNRLICTGYKLRGWASHTGHTLPWCILKGGGMEGKTVKKSRKSRIVHFEAQYKGWDKKNSTSKITITLSGGKAFTIKGDSETIAAYISAQSATGTPPQAEFAGLASDAILRNNFEDAESLEFDTLIMVEEEQHQHRVRINWCNHTNHNQTAENSLLTSSPFYLDSGATVHISLTLATSPL